ncbi:hypothetical protein CONCODRAFT_12877 [Conidiobolus coronatus NRRL 28638]|uniref:RNI-like protein n=1 Tax=Conidiobolus coronatus (strain ATCC 28846 / CBS 209.66 / NRRL 28638) TaxID=796925 RepID=A0A137NRZ2_CONC2|nr:hypothetical protein CONCODRAFT_12877 [Conidiobolus coronatus NRRL 28638]|eukprot:KXN65517.1 hypothetical protein CONCODRAFT_12877 [Conidiobolus coronatus NRRL 28638]
MLIWITFEDIQYLLNNLECLEDLQFISNYIFKSEPEPVDFSINWPQTLKKLTIGRNTELLVYNKYDPIPIDPNEYYLDLPKTQHLLLPTHLPNLESLSLKHWEGKFDDKLEFLKACPQIKKLSFPSVEEIPQIFNIIRSFNNLEHLEILLDCFGYEKESEIINFTIPCNLKSLTIQCRYYPYVIQFFNESFLQITNLNVISLYLSFDELLLFINNLSAMQLLKKLKLSFELNLYEFNEAIGSTVFTPIKTNVIKFPKLDNLESIEFKSVSKYDNYNIKMDLSQFKFRIDECPKLKCIGFRSDTKSECFGEIGSNKLGLGDDWRLISTPRRYLLHKVNQ